MKPSKPVSHRLGLEFATSLHTVKLGNSHLDDDGAVCLASFLVSNKSITSLDIGFNVIGDRGLSSIANSLRVNTSLRTLYLSANKITGEGLVYLEKALVANNTLTSLNLCGNRAGIPGARALASALRLNRTLETLHIGGNKVCAEGVAIISQALQQHPFSTIQQLDLSNNSIGDVGVIGIVVLYIHMNHARNTPTSTYGIAFSSALSTYKKIKLLDLSFNSITACGAKALACSLHGYDSLTCLKLDNNKLKGIFIPYVLLPRCLLGISPLFCYLDAGAISLASALTSMKLVYLNLGFNEIAADGLLAVLKTCDPNNCMRSLTLSGNLMSPQVIQEIASKLSTTSILTELYLDHMNIGQAGEKRIAAGIATNKSLALTTFSGFCLGPVMAKLESFHPSVGFFCEASNYQTLQHLSLIAKNPSDHMETDCIALSPSSSSSSSIHKSSPALHMSGAAMGCYPTHGFPEFKQEIVACSDVMLTESSFVLSRGDIAMLMSDTDASGELGPTFGSSPWGNATGDCLDLTEKHEAVSCLSPALSSEKHEILLKALKEMTALPFNEVEFLSLDIYYLTQPKSNEALMSVGQIGPVWPMKNTRKRRNYRENEIEFPQPDVCKKAVNFSSISRIAPYPRLREKLEALKGSMNHDTMLLYLRQLRFLEQYSSNTTYNPSCCEISNSLSHGYALLPFDIESLILGS